MKYKTKPGLNYHMKNVNCTSSSTFQSTADKLAASASINMISQNSNSNQATAMTSSRTHDADENTTNSVFESAYDEQNSSSSFPTISNHTKQSTHSGENPKKCFFCLTSEADTTVNVKNEKFVNCSECTRSFHPVCLNFTTTMIESLRKYNWQCVECKSKQINNSLCSLKYIFQAVLFLFRSIECTHCGNSENDVSVLRR